MSLRTIHVSRDHRDSRMMASRRMERLNALNTVSRTRSSVRSDSSTVHDNVGIDVHTSLSAGVRRNGRRRSKTRDTVGWQTVSCSGWCEECTSTVRSSRGIVSWADVMSERVSTSLDEPFIVGWELSLRGVVAEWVSSALRHVVRDVLLLLVMHRVYGVVRVLLRMMLRVLGVLRMSVHHHRVVLLLLVMHRMVLRGMVLSWVVNGLLLNEDLLVVLTSRAWVSACCTGCWWSSVRRVRTWSPVIEVFVFFDVHQART
jgi:hypothetical protein